VRYTSGISKRCGFNPGKALSAGFCELDQRHRASGHKEDQKRQRRRQEIPEDLKILGMWAHFAHPHPQNSELFPEVMVF
jgi:hypothetical protein